jgi:hypothetical protein
MTGENQSTESKNVTQYLTENPVHLQYNSNQLMLHEEVLFTVRIT